MPAHLIPPAPELIPLIGSFVVVVGWFVVYRLSVRAQKLTLRNQVMEGARMEIVDRIREQEDRCSRLLGTLMILETNLDAKGGALIGEHAVRETKGMDDATSPEGHRWASRLEEYEILYPETAFVRAEILKAQTLIMGSLVRLIPVAAAKVLDSRLPYDYAMVAQCTRRARGAVSDLLGLLQDLRVHLQNASLGPVVGRRLPGRRPKEGEVPIIRRTNKGLRIEPSGWKSRLDGIEPVYPTSPP